MGTVVSGLAQGDPLLVRARNFNKEGGNESKTTAAPDRPTPKARSHQTKHLPRQAAKGRRGGGAEEETVGSVESSSRYVGRGLYSPSGLLLSAPLLVGTRGVIGGSPLVSPGPHRPTLSPLRCGGSGVRWGALRCAFAPASAIAPLASTQTFSITAFCPVQT